MASDTIVTTAPAAKKATHGGKRANSGRKVRTHVEVVPGTPALDFLKQVYESPTVPLPLRIASAKAVVAATVQRPGADRIGKREQQQLDAQALAKSGGIFSQGRPPNNVLQMLDAKKVQER
jgi:hypothetical protein